MTLFDPVSSPGDRFPCQISPVTPQPKGDTMPDHDPFPWDDVLAEPTTPRDDATPVVTEVLETGGDPCGDPAPGDEVLAEAHRNPYVDDDPDPVSAARRSAEIDRSEADGLDRDDPRRVEVLASAERWDRQADDLARRRNDDAIRRAQDDDVIDAVIVCDCPNGESPSHEFTRGCVGHDDTPPAQEIELSAAGLNLDEVGDLLDTLADPDLLRRQTSSMRDTVLDAVRRRRDHRHNARPDDDRVSETTLRLEAVGAADDADVLAALAAVFSDGANEARQIAGELLDDLPQRGGKARASFRVGDGRGFELTVERSKRRELSVDTDAIVGVLIPRLLASNPFPEDDNSVRLEAFAKGARLALDEFRSLLSTSPTYRSTALDDLVRKLEDANEDDLAKRARAAYGRTERGEPTVKVTRKPLNRSEGES